MIKYIFLAAIASLVLVGCETTSNFEPKSMVRVISTTSYPEFPDIQPVAPVNLIPWNHEMPRNKNKVVVKNKTSCVNVPENERDDRFWTRCGENPIMHNSNIFIGFDQPNWNIIRENFAKLREAIYQHQQRIIAVNKQRQAWREKAEEERKRLQGIENQSNNIEIKESKEVKEVKEVKEDVAEEPKIEGSAKSFWDNWSIFD